MNLKNTILSALAATCAGCTVQSEKQNVAFKAADAIVVKNDATAKTKTGAHWYKAALADLTNAIAQVTGRVPEVFEETDYKSQIANCKAKEGNSQLSTLSSRPVIYFGETEAAKAAGIAGEGMRNGDWRVKTVPGKAYVYGKTGMAASYAMTEFVETFLDGHYLTPHTGLVATRDPACEVAIADVVRKPVIYVRDIYHRMYDSRQYPTIKPQWEDWARRRRSSWTDEIEGEYRVSDAVGRREHTIFHYLPPEKFFKDHPEWYSMGPDGKRKGVSNAQSELCYSNPEMKEEFYKSLVRFVEKEYRMHPDNPALIFDMTQMDNADFLCHCPACKKVIAKYNRKEGGHWEGGDAGLQLEFVNDLARRIRVKYPKVQLRVFAYVSTECAPKPGTIVPEPNVVIWWADVYGYSCHLYPLETPGHFNMHQAEEIGEWLRLTKNVQVWDYLLGGGDSVIPDAAVADARFFSEKGLPMMFMENEYSERAPFYFLNYYLLTQAYADPTKDPDALVHTFCRAYGKGAADMEAAILFTRKIQNREKVNDKQAWHMRNLSWFTAENYQHLADLCEAAYGKETDPAIRGLLLIPLKSFWSSLVGMYKKDPSAAAKFERAKEKFRRFGKEYARYGYVEEKSRKGREADVDDALDVLTLKFDDLPAELKGVPAKDLLCLDYHTFEPWQRNFVDPNAFRQRALVLAPDQNFGKGFPIACGVYDFTSKEHYPFQIKAADLPADGKYHWVKHGTAYLGRDTKFYFPGSWVKTVPLKQHHIYADGLPVDPNWYEVWSSFAVNGPAFIPGSKEQNTIRLDRMVFRRVAPPKRK